MKNKYKGTCYRCGLTVDAGKGHFESVSKKRDVTERIKDNLGWLVQHKEFAILYRGTTVHYIHNPSRRQIKREINIC